MEWNSKQGRKIFYHKLYLMHVKEKQIQQQNSQQTNYKSMRITVDNWWVFFADSVKIYKQAKHSRKEYDWPHYLVAETNGFADAGSCREYWSNLCASPGLQESEWRRERGNGRADCNIIMFLLCVHNFSTILMLCFFSFSLFFKVKSINCTCSTVFVNCRCEH